MKRLLRRLERAGWTPHAGQLEYLLCRARFRILACGRRWGKTDAAAADIALRVASTKESRQLAVAPTLEQARLVFDRIGWMLTALGVAFTSVLSPHPTHRIYEDGTNKKKIIHVVDARSGNEPRFLRGRGADHILVDEAAFVQESLITEVAMPMLAASGGRMSLVSTPFGRNAFYSYFRLGEEGHPEFWSRRSPSAENPAVDRTYLALQRELLTERAYRTEYEAEFCDSLTTVFPMDALHDALAVEPVRGGAVVMGVDWARYKDYTAFVALRGTRDRAEVIECGRWTHASWSESVRRIVEIAGRCQAGVVCCDATGGGNVVAEQLAGFARNFVVLPFEFTARSKPELIEGLVWALEQRRIRLLASADLMRELEHYEASPSERGVRYSGSGGFHDDLVCALALANHALVRAAPPTFIARARQGGLSK